MKSMAATLSLCLPALASAQADQPLQIIRNGASE